MVTALIANLVDKVEEGDFPEENLGDKEVLETIFKNSDEATEEGMEDGLEDFLERFDPNEPLLRSTSSPPSRMQWSNGGSVSRTSF